MSKRLNGIDIWAYLLIVTSIFQLIILWSAGYEYYVMLHQELSADLIKLRYAVSWIIKVIGILIGIGLMLRLEWVRKLAILNSLVILLTVHLKHSYKAYKLHTRHLDEAMQAIGGLPNGVYFSDITIPALWVQRGIDIIFASLLIFYLTRHAVKLQFR